MTPASRALAFLGAAVLTILPASAAAHTRSESYSTWSVDGGALIGRFQVGAVRATQLIEADGEALNAAVARHLGQAVSATQAGEPCAARAPRPLAAEPGEVRVELRLACPLPVAAAPATLRIAAFREVSPDHVHYAVVAGRETLIGGARDTVEVGGPAKSAPGDVAGFARLGLAHVLSGADHLAFILALALLAGGPRRAVLAATGFTVGHSLTLGLTTVGWLDPDTRAVEALIGFTVVYAAWEALTGRIGGGERARLAAAVAVAVLPIAAAWIGRPAPPWPVYAGAGLFVAAMGKLDPGSRVWAPVLLAAAFGLAHGAGFAGALIELELPRERLLPALLGFNLGVEAAQLLALAVLWTVALCVARLPAAARELGFALTCAGLALVGSYWFVARTVG